MERKRVLRTCILMMVLVFSMFTFINQIIFINGAENFQMEWGNQTIAPETWIKVNLNTMFEEPIVVATPEYQTTTNAYGISPWVTNITYNSFMLRVSDSNLGAADNINVHYIVIEKGNWTLPGTSIKIEAGNVSTTKYGYQGSYGTCPTNGETVYFTSSFSNNPAVFSTRTSNTNPNIWATTLVSETGGVNEVGTTDMCLRLSRSRAGTATFSNLERLDWLAVETGTGNIGGVEFEILYPGYGSTDWVGGGYPGSYSTNWAHFWSSNPIVSLIGETTLNGGDGGWAVLYSRTTSQVTAFIDESEERAHTGEAAGVFGFASNGNVSAQSKIRWDTNNLLVGYPTINEGDENNVIDFYSYKNNSNIQLNCISGNCSVFSEDWSNGNDAGAFEYNTVNFTCSDNAIGVFNATYQITSDEDSSGSLLNVSCQVFKVYADLSVTMLSPNPSVDLEIAQNRTFTLSARVDCIGDPGTNCANVSGAVRYNAVSLYGDGSDGSLVVSSTDTVVNDYAYLTGDELTGDNIINVNDASSFNNDDEILIIQMQNGSGNGVAGLYEFTRISSISGNQITLNKELNNSYYSGIFDSINAEVSQIVRIPQYVNVTVNSGSSITASAWDGYTGGIVIFRSEDKIDLEGFVDVSYKGYRGGTCGACGNNDWGTQGEGYLGIGTGVLTANGNGGGGGYGPSGINGEPGAGGGHATAGEDGASTYFPNGGEAIGSSNLDLIFFGGGSGAGGDNDLRTPFPEDVDGGGIVILFSPIIENARINADGEDGTGNSGAGGSAGGGAGGSIWLVGDDIQITSVTALGGASYDDGDDYGGAGANGRIRVDYNTLSGNSNPVIGYSGTASIGTGVMSLISTTFGNKPLWTSSSNPASCGLMNEGETCTLNWLINASGNINTSYLVDVIFSSDVIKVREQITQNLTVNITDNIIPQFTLISPNDNLKFISGNIIEFNWTVNDDDSWVNCSFYINDIFNKSVNCSTSSINNLSLDINVGGFYNWSVRANDSDNNIGFSPVWDFVLIMDQEKSVEKSVSFESLNLYKIENILIDIYNSGITLIEWVVNDFISGSQTPLSYWINITSDGEYIGWNVAHNNSINHSISGVGNYKTRENYIIGLD